MKKELFISTMTLIALTACSESEKAAGGTIEDNNAMTESYLMISPDGHLFQNGNSEYSYSRPLTEVSFAEALQDIKFNEAKFDGRYDGSFTWQAVHAMEKFFGIIKPEDPFDSIFKDICL